MGQEFTCIRNNSKVDIIYCLHQQEFSPFDRWVDKALEMSTQDKKIIDFNPQKLKQLNKLEQELLEIPNSFLITYRSVATSGFKLKVKEYPYLSIITAHGIPVKLSIKRQQLKPPCIDITQEFTKQYMSQSLINKCEEIVKNPTLQIKFCGLCNLNLNDDENQFLAKKKLNINSQKCLNCKNNISQQIYTCVTNENHIFCQECQSNFRRQTELKRQKLFL